MNRTRNFIRIGLLVFVAAAVATAVLKQPSADIAPEASETSVTPATPVGDALVATFFHGETRCPTCRKIESYTRQAIDEAFADELRSGRIQWQTANYEDPANKQLASDYDVYASTVVLTRQVDGKPVQWKNLDRVWNYVGKEQEFKDYVQQQTRELLLP
jgi:hypothetical protein